MLPQLLSPLLPLIDAGEILMMQRRRACGSPASLGAGRARGREGEAGSRSGHILIHHCPSFIHCPAHPQRQPAQGLSGLGLLCL